MNKMTISNQKKLGLLILSSLFILMVIPLSAQNSNVNFSGNWVLNESKSNFGDSPFRMAPTTLVVKHDGINLSDERTQPGFDGGEMKTTEKLTLDGKVCENIGMMESKRKSTVAWSADKKAIAIATTMVFDMGGETREMKSSETWKLGEGGTTLIVESSMVSPEGEMKSTAVYDKK